MLDGTMNGYVLFGENPAVGSSNSRLHRLALARLDWLVVRDLYEIESATFWCEGPEVETGEIRTEECGTEVFFLPAAAHVEKDGSFTNTQRLLQWHTKAVEPTGDRRSDLWFAYHLGRRIRERLAGSTEPRDRPVQQLRWELPTDGPTEEPSAAAVLREINGTDAEGRALGSYMELKADGSTACGCWIYCGVFAGEENRAARRTPHWEQGRVPLDWGWSWPSNRRILYNRASADPAGRRGRSGSGTSGGTRSSGAGRATTSRTSRREAARLRPGRGRAGRGRDPRRPSVRAPGRRRGWLYAPSGLVDGPFPTHYEPHESPVENVLYGQASNPVRQLYRREENPYEPEPGRAGTTPTRTSSRPIA